MIDKAAILKALSGQPDRLDNKALARQLGVKGEDRRVLRQLLREMVDEGVLKKSKNKTFREADDLPGVMVIRVTGLDEHGDMVGEPEIWKQDGPKPKVIVREGPISKKAKGHKSATVGVGSRALCRISKKNGEIIAQVMKRLGAGPTKSLGILYQGGRGWRIQPVDKKARHDYKPVKVQDGAQNNDLVWFQSTRRNQGDLRLAEIVETVGSADGGKAASLISLYQHEIPVGFPDDVIADAKALKLPKLSKYREDLRHLPLVTIDPVDAKDFDDAITATPTKNSGWDVWVAIADVAAFVTPDSPLDRTARNKGNSVYLPDRVEPMLPHELSSDLCSLRPNEDRACMGLKWSLGERASTKRLNTLLKQADEKGLSETVGMSVLRSQSQAIYDPDPKGHFGLNLTHYAHFTSPIRRYADLVVHRALIDAFDLGEDGTSTSEASRLKEISEHISNTERRAMKAERDSKDRYIAAFLEKRVGAHFAARITGVTKFGLFITLDETGADGLIPSRSLGREYFVFDEKRKALIGADSGGTYRFGRQIKVKLVEATPITGGLIFEILTKPEPGKRPARNAHRGGSSRPKSNRGKRRR